MSKKRLLNLTSRKKRDTMLSWSNTSNTGASRAVAAGPLVLNAGSYGGGTTLWCPTGRDLDLGGTVNTVANESARTATTCFMRGLSENIRIQTSSGLPWFHRRICFTFKGPQPFRQVSSSDSPTQAPNIIQETTAGMVRLWLNSYVNATPNTRNNHESYIFKGANGTDWDDILTAPVDTRRISVKFNKVWTIKSGNAAGTVVDRKLWHGMNKNLVYDDDESGPNEISTYYSVDSKAGMGDYYVYDIFTPGVGGTTSDYLQVQSCASMYWHEK